MRGPIQAFAAEFDATLAAIESGVRGEADELYKKSNDRVDNSKELKASRQARTRIDEQISDYSVLKANLEKLQQLLLITEDMKNELVGLQRQLDE